MKTWWRVYTTIFRCEVTQVEVVKVTPKKLQYLDPQFGNTITWADQISNDQLFTPCSQVALRKVEHWKLRKENTHFENMRQATKAIKLLEGENE